MHNLSNLDKLGTQYLKYQYIQAQNFLIWTKLHPTVRKKKIESSPKQTLSQISTNCKHNLVAEFSNLVSNLDQTSVICQNLTNQAKSETQAISNINTLSPLSAKSKAA